MSDDVLLPNLDELYWTSYRSEKRKVSNILSLPMDDFSRGNDTCSYTSESDLPDGWLLIRMLQLHAHEGMVACEHQPVQRSTRSL